MKLYKKCLSLLLALVMLLGLVPASVMAAPATYKVGLDDMWNGKVTRSVEEAAEGETVTLTPAPFEGYLLDSIKVVAIESGTELALTGGIGDECTFTMPASDVQVQATFRACANYTVTFDANGGSGTMADQTFAEDSTWTIPACEFIPPAGKEFDSWLISSASGTQPHFPLVENPGKDLEFNFDAIAQALWKDAPVTAIPAVGLDLTLPDAGGSYSGAVPASVSISSGECFTVKSANWYNAGGIAPSTFEAGEDYFAEILLLPWLDHAFTGETTVTIDTLGVKTKAIVDDEADNMGCLRIVTDNYTIPGTAATEYPVWVGGVQVTSENKDDILGDGTAKYDPGTSTLTLNGLNVDDGGHPSGASIVARGVDLTVTGSATLSGAVGGIYVPADSEGGGNLTLDDAAITYSVAGGKVGIYADVSITVNGGKIDVSAAEEEGIASVGNITINGGTVTVAATGDDSRGIYTTNELAISGGTVTAKGESSAIYGHNKLVISGGTVTANGGGIGLRSARDLTISGGEVTATATGATSAAIASANITISGGTVKAVGTGGESYGIRAGKNLQIENGITEVTADGTSEAMVSVLNVTTIGDELMIKEPIGGKLSGDSKVIKNADDTDATHAVIVPKEPLPKVIGVMLNVTGIVEGGGAYNLNSDVKEALFESSTAPVAIGTSFLFTDPAVQPEDKLTAAPVAGTPYYFILNLQAYTDGDPATLEWADNDTIKSGSTLTADKGTVELVEIAHSPAGGSMSIICKYTETPVTYPVEVVVTTWDKDGNIISAVGGTATADKTEAAKGDTINVTITPNEGFALESIDFGDGVTGGYQQGKETSSTVPDDFTTSSGELQIDVVFKEIPPANYTVKFNANGGSGTMADMTVTEGDKLTLPDCGFTPQKGKEFEKWDAGAPGEQVEITSDCTITAIWKDKAVYTVTFETNGGSTVAGQKVIDGDKATKPADPTREGYTFDGWYGDATLNTAFDFDTAITADMTVYAKWEEVKPATYTVTFETNGGSSVADQTVTDGEKAAKPADPTREGYIFEGWYADATFAAAFDFDTVITADVTVYAKWEEIKPATYTVTFETNGGSSVADQTVTDGEKAAKPADPTREGYIFDGWYADAAFATTFDFDTAITADTTVYAKWEEVKTATYTVTFETNGGSAVADQTVTEGDKATKPVDPTREGYIFDGWYADATFAAAFDFDTAITADTTVYAKWEEVKPATYTVTFETNGGSAMAVQTVTDGDKATKPADPTREGYTFDGWYTDATFATAFDFDTAITTDTTVYAKWTEEAAPGEIAYTVVRGGNSTWTKGSNSDVTIVVKRNVDDNTCFSHFTSVQIDGTTLVRDTDYTAASGSTVITLKASALEKLSAGTKTVTIHFDDGKAATKLTIKTGSVTGLKTSSPRTGDDSSLALWYVLMILSGLSLGGLIWKEKKRRQGNRR